MNGIIRDRVNSFYKDLLGAEFLSLLYYSGGIITGSSLLNIIIDNNAIPTPIDIDIFIPIQKLHNIFKSLKDGFIYSNSSVININNRSHLWINMKGDKINLDILVTTVDPLIILSEVDFTITMNNFNGRDLIISYPEDIKQFRLVVNNNFKGILNKERLEKYISRGFKYRQ